MRLVTHIGLAIAIGAVVGRVGAAQTPAQQKTDSARPQTPAADSQLENELSRAQNQRGVTVRFPRFDQFTLGDRTVAAGSTVPTSVAVARGTLDLYGTVNGDAVALDGDIHLHPGARVTGDAVAIAGRVIVDGGTVLGEMRSLAGNGAVTGTGLQFSRQPRTTLESVKLAIGWFAVLAILGIGVMIFSEHNLDGVAVALEQGFGRAFWIGFAGQLLLLPVLLLLVSALAITVIGVLLVPFAIVAYVIAAAGLLTLGFLAVARIVGAALSYDSGSASPRGVHVRSLLGGLVIFAILWVVAAAFSWNPLAGGALRALAIAVTWVAATLGLGGALVSRAGTHRDSIHGDALTTGDYLAWQTPTPVAGVSAARRART